MALATAVPVSRIVAPAGSNIHALMLFAGTVTQKAKLCRRSTADAQQGPAPGLSRRLWAFTLGGRQGSQHTAMPNHSSLQFFSFT